MIFRHLIIPLILDVYIIIVVTSNSTRNQTLSGLLPQRKAKYYYLIDYVMVMLCINYHYTYIYRTIPSNHIHIFVTNLHILWFESFTFYYCMPKLNTQTLSLALGQNDFLWQKFWFPTAQTQTVNFKKLRSIILDVH